VSHTKYKKKHKLRCCHIVTHDLSLQLFVSLPLPVERLGALLLVDTFQHLPEDNHATGCLQLRPVRLVSVVYLGTSRLEGKSTVSQLQYHRFPSCFGTALHVPECIFLWFHENCQGTDLDIRNGPQFLFRVLVLLEPRLVTKKFESVHKIYK
jgi:hypothetical protein